MSSLPLTITDVRAARGRIAGRIRLTPVVGAHRIGMRSAVRLWLKLESFQKTGSFKARGALARIDALTDDERRRGVIAVSAGNHAQAVAWAATAAGVSSTIVMMRGASPIKVEATRGYGGEVVLYGDRTSEAFAKAREIEKERGLVFVHPFDDAMVAAGAGTVGLEILEQLDDVDAIVVPIGGGGLIAGVAVAVKAVAPHVKIYGVEPEYAPSMKRSLEAGRALEVTPQRTIADGLGAPMAGEMAFEIVRSLCEDVVLVSEEEIMQAMRDLAIYSKVISEGAAAASVAAITTRKLGLLEGSRVVAIVTGGNVDPERMGKVLSA